MTQCFTYCSRHCEVPWRGERRVRVLRIERLSFLAVMVLAVMVFTMALLAGQAFAGGPRWVTGTSYFNRPGIPVAWAGGQVRYYTDQGPLSSTVDNAAANALVAAAAAPWNGVVYATVNISQGGTLAEDVNGSNTSAGPGGVVFPADVQSTNLGVPLAVLYDADGSLTDAMLGQGASDPADCWQNGVTESVDNITQNGVIVHAVLVLNGLCTGGPEAQLQMQYQLERMFGRVLGLGWSQLADNVFTGTPVPTLADQQSWPIMHPIDVRCGPYTYQCMVNPFTLRMDDQAALGRLYPVTSQNIAQYPGKQDIWKSSIGISGQALFADGQPMQGVNLVVRYISPDYSRLWAGSLVSVVTGNGFRGNAGNPVTGYASAGGARFDQFGSVSSAEEGYFSILGTPQTLEPGRTGEGLLFIPEAINPLYTGEFSVGPYTMEQVKPSGVLSPFVQSGVANGANYSETFTASNSAADRHFGLDGTETAPADVPSSGYWTEQFAEYGHTGWYGLKVQANRSFTVETMALDQLGNATRAKAMPVIGIWNGSDPLGSAPDARSAAAFNGAVTAGTTAAASTVAAEQVRIAIADQRGDGRPDYIYQARVLYADHISPAAISPGGGTVTITGMGFRAGNTVTINGVPATVTSGTATEMVVDAPPMGIVGGAAGAPVDVTVSDPVTGGSTTMSAALAYSSSARGVTDQLVVISGGGQAVSSAINFAPVEMEVTDGAGNAVPHALVQVYQTVTTYQQCSGHGRCAPPQLLGAANTAERSDANGMISVDPLQIANRAQTVNIVATAEARGVVRVALSKHP